MAHYFQLYNIIHDLMYIHFRYITKNKDNML